MMSAAETRARGCTATAIRCACVKVFEVKLTLVIAHYNLTSTSRATSSPARNRPSAIPAGYKQHTRPAQQHRHIVAGWPCVIPFK